MRILSVRFKNLNSLREEWHIDFTHPDYVSNGIFTITGPTGAGKTTILDAVCLGLYGRTPRLDRVTKSSNEVMSRQTGECFAEVTFETAKGCYRCHWSQHRARKKPEGDLQPPRHEVVDAGTGNVLESRILQVAGFVEEATGMDFDRFTRSMLLAQGDFAVFLMAPANERADILEQITGTGIYSLISMKVHERRNHERNRLEQLMAELKGIRVLSVDEEQGLNAGLGEKHRHEEEVAARLEGLRTAASWLETVAGLEQQLCELDRLMQEGETRRAAFEPDALRLERARRALGLEGDYRGVADLRMLQEHETRDLHGAQDALPLRNRACEEALSVMKAARIGLDEARNRQQAEAAVIRKVRDLDTRRGEQAKRIRDMDASISGIEKQARGYQATIDEAATTLQKSRDSLEAVHDYQAAHADDAALQGDLAAIAQVFTSLDRLEHRAGKSREALKAAAKNNESADAAYKKILADHEKSRKEFEKQQAGLEALKQETVSVLKGREMSWWHREYNALKEREGLLKQAGDIIERMGRTSSALEDIKARLEALHTGGEKLSGEISTCTDRRSRLEASAADLEIQVNLLSRIRDLEEERKRLVTGKPCPLCGSVEHPYAQGAIPELNDAETRLKDARTGLREVNATLGRLEAGQAKILSEIGHTEKDRDEKEDLLIADEKQCSIVMDALQLVAGTEDRGRIVRGETADVQARIAHVTDIIAAGEKNIIEEQAAQKILDEHRELKERSGRALQDALHGVDTARHEHERLTQEALVLDAEVEKACAAALGYVEPYGIREIRPAKHRSIVEALTGRRDIWQAKLEEKTGCEKTIRDLEARIDKQKALLEKLEHDLNVQQKDREDQVHRHEELDAERLELYGEKDTDNEEKRLAHAVDRAGESLEKAREDHDRMQQELGALKDKIDGLEQKIQRRAAGLVQSEKELSERIARAGFKNEADYLSARLDEEVRTGLEETEQGLIREKTQLDARRKDKAEALQMELEKRLTDQTPDTVRQDMIEAESELKQLRLDIGGMVRALDENQKLRELQQERMKGIDAQRAECSRWDDLHELIGSADGKKFRNFAQGLTFEMMIAHANRQLRKMTDRYVLIRDGLQPLELDVIDNYQAGEIRSTKNLSGGESFIVSLALALGLSQMASRKVRVDSLFLDEGFGTLDEDALETALETLAGLRQDGKLIGVISHVPALKERIGTQIQVIPETGGRSTLAGPGCSRVPA